MNIVWYIVFCFFFKQKTAYEMRISDWSSDVGSSDLTGAGLGNDARLAHAARQQYLAYAVIDLVRPGMVEVFALEPALRPPPAFPTNAAPGRPGWAGPRNACARRRIRPDNRHPGTIYRYRPVGRPRIEEHTSTLPPP